MKQRSQCPINLSVEVLGDRWTLVVLRDVIFGDRRYFRELLTRSEEGIASNILADRLHRLVERGLLTRGDDPTHAQKIRYDLTEMAIQLVPVLAELGAWGSAHLPVSDALSIRARLLHEGGRPLWERFMHELRIAHLEGEEAEEPTVWQELQAAYEERLARAKRRARRRKREP